MLPAIARFFNRPTVHIISGIIIILCGLSNMDDGINEFIKQSNLPGDRIGLLFLGLSATLTKGLLSMFKFMESTTKGALGTRHKHFKIVHSVKRTVEHWLFELGGGVLLLACGVLEVFENWLDNDLTNNDSMIWFVGLITIGVVKIITTLPEMIEATVILEHVEHKKGWHMQAVHLIDRKLRNPKLEVSLAFFLLAIGFLEEILLPIYQQGYTPGLSFHHGIIVYGFSHFSKIMPDVMASKTLIQDAFVDGAS